MINHLYSVACNPKISFQLILNIHLHIRILYVYMNVILANKLNGVIVILLALIMIQNSGDITTFVTF